MKVALFFHGQPRYIENCFSGIKEKIIDVYNPDIYCHMWWSEEDIEYEGARFKFPHDKDAPTKIKDMYSPKIFMIEKSYTSASFFEEYPEYEFYKKFPSHFAYLSQFLSIYKVANSFNWNHYDVIIKWRFDTYPKIFPDLYSLPYGKMYTPTDYHGTHIGRESWSDLGNINPPSVKHLYNIFDYLKYDTREISEKLPVIPPEDIYLFYGKKFNLLDKIVKLPVNEYNCLIAREYNTFH